VFQVIGFGEQYFRCGSKPLSAIEHEHCLPFQVGKRQHVAQIAQELVRTDRSECTIRLPRLRGRAAIAAR
jgi:hypothetical protein